MAVLPHDFHLADRAVMLAMRAALAVSAKPVLGPESRPGFDAMISRTPALDGVAFEAGEVGGVAGWWCRPRGADPSAAILYLHGGAFVLGSAVAYRHFAGQVAARAGAMTFVADYALAPERPFPAAFSDARAAFDGLGELGARRITLCGDSAGGGLALALLIATTRTLRPALGAAVMSPWIDLSLSGASMQTRSAADPLLSRDALAEATRLYLNGGSSHDPQASALDGDFGGMAPVRIHVGDAEVLLDDAVRFAKRAEGMGRICDAHVWDGIGPRLPGQPPAACRQGGPGRHRCVPARSAARRRRVVKVAVLGATGRTGRVIIREARRQSHAMTALVRSEAKAGGLAGTKLVVGDARDGAAEAVLASAVMVRAQFGASWSFRNLQARLRSWSMPIQ